MTKLEFEMEAIKLDLGILKATVATKTDLAEAIAKVNADTRSSIAEVKAETKAGIAEAKNTIIVWVVGSVFLAQLLPGLLRKLGLQ
ncbi:hypothetical protein SR858_10065 [Duganella zoogloeoides]|uniref:DUF1640 domain-containing protein n=1 Tax=Duganella zoogloeoides TaxID=75659 RepID=A0ABZ0Y3M9_9BURK|nr:hypothetical protein [Duganella zoogloeoides]WQH06642.1 hypothetical protein SR858_10065 [Duganella zoogloeoides]